MISGANSAPILSSTSVNASLMSCQLCHMFVEQSQVHTSKDTSSIVKFCGHLSISSTLVRHIGRWLKAVGQSRIKLQVVRRSRMMAITMIPLMTSLGTGTGQSIIRWVSVIILTSQSVKLSLGIAATLIQLYKAVLSQLKVVEETKLSQWHSPTLVNRWEKMDDTPKWIDGEWTSPYLPWIKNSTLISLNVCPTYADVLDRSSNPG